MEDVHEMRASGVEDKTLVWIDSSRRDPGGTGSDYTVSMVEPLRNVVGIRVIEATIPATIMSVGDHNSKLCLQSIGFTDDLPVAPEHALVAHTAGVEGLAWRVHDSTEKKTYYDPGHDAEHHIASRNLDVYRTADPSLVRMLGLDAALDTSVLCVVPGNTTSDMGPAASYDPVALNTVVSCQYSPEMQYVCSIEMVAGVYRLPHGKYDSLRDFVSELSHRYSDTKVGIMLDFLAPITDKPERSFQMKINPSLVWTHVDTASPAFEHTYMTMPNYWCAVWSGSPSIQTLGFQLNPVELTTAAGDFMVSEPQARYKGCLRGRTMVDLTSERYVWLRCPEVERHMCSGVGKVLQRGIGVFRLDVPGILNQDRTEYISVIPTQFHPICKVSKLSFRFDMGSKENVPYDFREINHFMLLSISTLHPDKSLLYTTLPKALNPDYDPNILAYHMREYDRKTLGCRDTQLTPAEVRRVVDIHNSALVTNSDGR
jgi:hypothetical protein